MWSGVMVMIRVITNWPATSATMAAVTPGRRSICPSASAASPVTAGGGARPRRARAPGWEGERGGNAARGCKERPADANRIARHEADPPSSPGHEGGQQDGPDGCPEHDGGARCAGKRRRTEEVLGHDRRDGDRGDGAGAPEGDPGDEAHAGGATGRGARRRG